MPDAIELSLLIRGSSHDGLTWPKCRVIINQQTLFDGDITGATLLNLTAEIDRSNKLIIEHYGKIFGENRIWHTTKDGDRNIVIEKMILGGVDISMLTHLGVIKSVFNQRQIDDFMISGQDVPYEKRPSIKEQIFMGFNGCYELEFNGDVYDWIIVNKTPFVRPFDPKKQSSLNSVNWRLDWVNSNEIKSLFNEIQTLVERAR